MALRFLRKIASPMGERVVAIAEGPSQTTASTSTAEFVELYGKLGLQASVACAHSFLPESIMQLLHGQQALAASTVRENNYS
jgi:hypothetical protein